MEEEETRDITFDVPSAEFPSNLIKTSKYSWYNFLCKNLFEQFHRMANIYFVVNPYFSQTLTFHKVICFLQTVPAITTSKGIPVNLFGLSIVLLMTLVRDGIEDYERHKADKEENNQMYKVLKVDEFKRTNSENIRVGNIIKVETFSIIYQF